MEAPRELVLRCSGPSELIEACHKMIDVVPPEVGRQLGRVLGSYFLRYGLDEAYERLNGRCVSELANEDSGRNITPVASGSRDGVQFTLYESPDDDPTRDEELMPKE